jgi:hypothetical protein
MKVVVSASEKTMKIIAVKHKGGTLGDKTTNVGVIAASTSGGEIACSWRASDFSTGEQKQGSAVYRASSPIYRSDNPAAAGVLTIPLNRVDATIAAVTFLNNTDKPASVTLAVSVGNNDGSYPQPEVFKETVAPGESTSIQINFILK